VEGLLFFCDGPMQQFKAATGFKTEAEARKWASDQKIRDVESEQNGETE
jgi:hypothetical protein